MAEQEGCSWLEERLHTNTSTDRCSQPSTSITCLIFTCVSFSFLVFVFLPTHSLPKKTGLYLVLSAELGLRPTIDCTQFKMRRVRMCEILNFFLFPLLHLPFYFFLYNFVSFSYNYTLFFKLYFHSLLFLFGGIKC